ncbi:peptidase M3, partial [Paludibacteraceae bacterium OttesenSCG-928-F17]|nr:peptidase M3 [Paludibacteraceae bacterium OttesenSCG-928-F17]
MKKSKLIIFMTALTVSAAAWAANPFFSEYNTPHGTVPFDKIKVEDYMPAFEKAMEENKKEIEAIVNNPEAPTFENTIVALEHSGKLLSKVASPFYNLLSAETNDEMQALAQQLSPMMTEHSNSINL